MNQVIPLQKVFNYQGKQVRTIVRDGEPWFVAVDVCGVLELNDARKAVERLDGDERSLIPVTDSLGRRQETYVVNEAGLYALILGSRKTEAKLFKRWITHDVIPAIRQTGHYDVNERRLPRTYIEALEELVATEKARMALEEQLALQAPKVELYDILLSAKNAQTMNEVSKAFGWGRNKLFAFLREQQILMRNNLPYQKYLDAGYFEVREVTTNRGDYTVNVTQTLVTAKGLHFIGEVLRQTTGIVESV